MCGLSAGQASELYSVDISLAALCWSACDQGELLSPNCDTPALPGHTGRRFPPAAHFRAKEEKSQSHASPSHIHITQMINIV